jgi:hypothetical protein
VSGNSLTVHNNLNLNDGSFTRVTDATNPIIGTWSNLKINGVSTPYGDGTNLTLTFFANGDYMQAQSTTPPFATSGAVPGLEHGAYTWNSSTGAFTTPSCPPIDTNGNSGFSSPNNGCVINNTIVTVTGNTMLLMDNSTNPATQNIFTRVTP